MNARYLARMGYGMCIPRTTKAALGEFIGRLPEFENALRGYDQAGNSVTLQAVEDRALAAADAVPSERRRERHTARRRAPRRRSAKGEAQ